MACSPDPHNRIPDVPPGRRPIRILVVDDDESFSTMLQDLLLDSGYDVTLMSDGPSCINYCERQKPDLILLDIRMPGMDGFEVCRALKENKQTADIPIILLSGLTETEHKIRGFSLGVFHYLTKPFPAEELLARVENILGRQRLVQQALEASKVDTVRQLSVTLADRINNPLAGIMACCQILSKHIDDREKVIAIVENIKESVDQIYSVLVKLSQADRVESAHYSQGINMIDVEKLPEPDTNPGSD